MPTSYTAPIYEGEPITFDQFVMRCARAMGAYIHMRDEPLDAPATDPGGPSDYHARQAEAAAERLAAAEKWSIAQAYTLAKALHAEQVESARESEEKEAALTARYEAMLADVMAWEPPTEEHVGLKDFMAQQLRESIKFDTGFRHAPGPQMTGSEYRDLQIEAARKNLDYHRAEQAKEQERAESRRAWTEALRGSLAGEAVAS